MVNEQSTWSPSEPAALSIGKVGSAEAREIVVFTDGLGADLLVMGAYGHTQLREWMFGGVTRTVLYEAGLPVLMSR
jgi:nucleotide-binding universal stress UspA family protein